MSLRPFSIRCVVLFLALLALVSGSASAQLPQSERDALIAIYNALGGDEWVVGGGGQFPGPPGQECFSWFESELFLFCSAEGVEVLFFFGNNLNGSLPPEIGSFPHLKELVFFNETGVTGPIPEEIGGNTSLEFLEFYSIGAEPLGLTGDLPDSLGKLAQLRTLIFLSGFPGALGPSGTLPDSLANLASLELILLWNTAIGGDIPAGLFALPSLQHVDFVFNQFTGDIPDLTGASGLEFVRLAEPGLSPGPVPDLSGLPNLIGLDLSYSNRQGAFPDWVLARTNMTYLDLGNADFPPGPVPPELAAFSALRILGLQGTNRTGPFPEWLCDLGLTFLLLSDNAFDPGPLPECLREMDALSSLHLGNTRRTGTIPEWLGELEDLQFLTLSHNHLTGFIPESLGDLDLFGLKLESNRLVGQVPASLTNLQNLGAGRSINRGLDIRWNGLSQGDPDIAAFLNDKQDGPRDWRNTQTMVVRGQAAVAASPTSIEVSWFPIRYREELGGDPGFYAIFASTEPDGGFEIVGRTGDKNAGSFLVEGLEPATTYYFIVRALTEAHPDNANRVVGPSNFPVAANTPPAGE
jgi:hypothetical protein